MRRFHIGPAAFMSLLLVACAAPAGQEKDSRLNFMA